MLHRYPNDISVVVYRSPWGHCIPFCCLPEGLCVVSLAELYTPRPENLWINRLGFLYYWFHIGLRCLFWHGAFGSWKFAHVKSTVLPYLLYARQSTRLQTYQLSESLSITSLMLSNLFELLARRIASIVLYWDKRYLSLSLALKFCCY